MSEPKYAAGNSVPLTPEVGPLPYKNTALDVVMAGVYLVLGWLFWEMQMWQDGPWRGALANVALFSVLYAAAVLCWLFLSGIVPGRESWFWLVVMFGLAFSHLLPYAWDLVGFAQYAALLGVASYWTLSAGGRLYYKGSTSNWIGFDLFNMVFFVPWGNFGRLFAALWGAGRDAARTRRAARAQQGKSGRGKRAAAVAGGAAGAAVCLAVVLPWLMAADAGFAALFSGFLDALRRMNAWSFEDSLVLCLKLLCAVPTACYLYGLGYGAVKERHTALFEQREICAAQAGARRLPGVTVGMVLGVLGGVYVLFIAMQARYLFGAFWGALPEGFTYAEYARQGFFELCRVAGANAVILACANIFSRRQKGEWRALRLLNGALAALTLLLLATAAAKMALYIGAYGLTEKRVLASTALLWLVFVFTCVLLRQFSAEALRRLPLVRAAVWVGAVLFTLLCTVPVIEMMGQYNEAHGFVDEPAAAYSTVDSDMRSVDDGDTHAILWEGRRYEPVDAVDAGERGKLLGYVDGDEKDCVYEYQGHDAQEYIVEIYHSGLMDGAMLYQSAP